MAVGRRKRLFGSVVGTGSTAVYTAPTAPLDGSAAATCTLLTFSNNTGSAIVVQVIVGGFLMLQSFNVPATGNSQFGFSFDLMGGDSISMSASVGGGVTAIGFGVESKDA